MSRRVAILGCGLIGEKRARALTASQQLAAVYDPDFRRSRLVADLGSGTAVVSSSATEAIERAGPGGLVIVATTHDLLAELALEAASGGCHVLIEKPGGRRPAELESLAVMAEFNSTVVRVGFNHRFHPGVLASRELLIGEEAGPVIMVRGRYGHGGRIGYETEWRADPVRSGGGELLDQGVHLIDLVRYLTGPPSLKYAAMSTLFWEMPVEDNAFLHLGLASGGDGWLHASWTEWKNLFSLELTCREVKIELTGLGGSYGPDTCTIYRMGPGMGPPQVTTTQWPPGDRSWSDEMADVERELQGEPSIGASLADAIATLRIVEEAYGS